MGNKPNRIKKMKNKALRRFSQVSLNTEKASTMSKMSSIKPFNFSNAKMMIQNFKKEVEHVHLKNKPHHHKRTTPGSVDADNPMTKTGHETIDKTMKNWQKKATQKSSDLSKKYFDNSSFRKAA